MSVSIAINGFGRIGRLVLRALVENGRDDLFPVAINDLGSIEANAHLFRYDSVHGRFPGQVEIDGDTISFATTVRSYGPIKVSAERIRPRRHSMGVDVALECTGHFRQRTLPRSSSPPARGRSWSLRRLKARMRPSSMA